jgi:hypothetical protein
VQPVELPYSRTVGQLLGWKSRCAVDLHRLAWCFCSQGYDGNGTVLLCMRNVCEHIDMCWGHETNYGNLPIPLTVFIAALTCSAGHQSHLASSVRSICKSGICFLRFPFCVSKQVTVKLYALMHFHDRGLNFSI